jgi:transcriptional regulator with XRE-family HTH domain
MSSIGERLRRERETREMSVEDMAAATGIGQSYLDALELDQIDVLPGPAFGKLYIRAYAEVLGFDPQPWIDDYDRAQRGSQGAQPVPPEPTRPRPVAEAIARWKAERSATDVAAEPVEAERSAVVVEAQPEAPDEAPVEPPVEAVEAAIPPTVELMKTPRPRVAFVRLLVGAMAIAIVAAVYFGTRGTGGGPPPVVPAPESPAPVPQAPVVEAPPAPPPQTPPPTQAPVVRPSREPGSLTVTEFGLGRRIVNHRLEGEGDRFDQGTRVCFATRVQGGRRGEVVRHVWLYEGRIEQSIALTLGGADWRTYSNKTLSRAGSWTVEARDGKGGVLASVAFDCAAR